MMSDFTSFDFKKMVWNMDWGFDTW